MQSFVDGASRAIGMRWTFRVVYLCGVLVSYMSFVRERGCCGLGQVLNRRGDDIRCMPQGFHAIRELESQSTLILRCAHTKFATGRISTWDACGASCV